MSSCFCCDDWAFSRHSLINSEDGQPLLFANYSADYFPHPDEFLRYLRDFTQHYNLQQRIEFNTTVVNVRYASPDSAAAASATGSVQQQRSFVLTVRHNQRGVREVQCKTVIVCTGLSVPHKVHMHGAELATGYEDLRVSDSLDEYNGRRVLILGKGECP